MHAVVFLIIIGVIVAGGFLIAFIWAVKNGQYDDNYSHAVRILFDDDKPKKKKEEEDNNKDSKGEKDKKPVNSLK